MTRRDFELIGVVGGIVCYISLPVLVLGLMLDINWLLVVSMPLAGTAAVMVVDSAWQLKGQPGRM